MNQEKPLYARFLDLPIENTVWDSALSCLIQAPLENTTTFVHGTAAAPQAILRASEHIELYDTALERDISDLAIYTFPSPKLSGLSTKEALLVVEALVEKSLEAHKWPLLVGGEQTVSLAALKPLLKRDRDLCLVQFDAHLDLKDSYHGSGLSHRSALRRASELGLQVLHLGSRSSSREEAEFALSAADRFVQVPASTLNRSGVAALSSVAAKIRPTVYLSIDMSVLDPSICPGVSNPEPGGLSWETLLGSLNWCFENFSVVGADIVELAPIAADPRSEYLAARLAARIFDLHQTGTTP
jgi:agmatinase